MYACIIPERMHSRFTVAEIRCSDGFEERNDSISCVSETLRVRSSCRAIYIYIYTCVCTYTYMYTHIYMYNNFA